MQSIMLFVATAVLISTASFVRADVITIVSRTDTIYGTDGLNAYSQTGTGPLNDSVGYSVFNGGSSAGSETDYLSVSAGAASINTPSVESAFASTAYVVNPLASDVALNITASTGNAVLSPTLSASFAFYDITLGKAVVGGSVLGINQKEDQTFQLLLDPAHQYGLSLSASVSGRVGEVGAYAGVSASFSRGTGIPTFPPPEAVPLPSSALMAFFLASIIGGWATIRRWDSLTN